ncbi:MAG: LysM domain-containing protein, partial [Bacteroidota bacterium]
MKRSLILFFFLFSFIFLVSAQEFLKSMRSTVIEKIDGKEYYIHTIKKGQTLYMISKAYGVDVNDVIRENPGVKEGIKADEKLRIPTNRPMETPKKTPRQVVQPPKPPQQPVDTQQTIVPETILDLPCGTDKSALKDRYQVALMLPLFLGEMDEINTEHPADDAESAYH